MKSRFRGFYALSTADRDELWKNGSIVFDTNVLLMLYRYTEATRRGVLQLFAKLQERLWLPHQIATEFHNNRPDVIVSQCKLYEGILTEFQTFLNKTAPADGHNLISDEVKCYLDDAHRRLRDDVNRNVAHLRQLQATDTVLEEITRLFDGRVGPPLDVAQYKHLISTAEDRYSRKIPPGFCDKQKPIPDRYGDLILWQQTLRFAEASKKPLMFVTAEEKEDWWWKACDDRKLGPHPLLRDEMYASTDQPFHLYRLNQFIEHASAFLNTALSQNMIAEVESQQTQGSSPPSSWPIMPTGLAYYDWEVQRMGGKYASYLGHLKITEQEMEQLNWQMSQTRPLIDRTEGEERLNHRAAYKAMCDSMRNLRQTHARWAEAVLRAEEWLRNAEKQRDDYLRDHPEDAS